MFVKKFEAESLEAALAQVKEALGPEALILETQHKKKGFLQKKVVVVTAAFEQGATPAPKAKKSLADIFPHRKSPAPTEQVEKVEQDAPARRVLPESSEKRPTRAQQLAQKYLNLSDSPPAKAAPSPTAVAGQQDRFDKFESVFLKAGLSDESAKELTRRVLFDFGKEDLAVPSFREKALGSLLSGALRDLSEAEFLDSASWVAIGPAGAGKTSLLVKLALDLKTKGHSVTLVGLDKRKVLGVNELAAYAQLIHVPFEPEMREYGDSARIQLIDGPCLPFTDEKVALRAAESLKGKSVVLVVDGTRRLEEMLKSYEDAQPFFPRAVCFTRWDEALKLGTVYDFLRRTRLPILGISQSRSFKAPFSYLKKNEMVQQLFSFAARGEQRGEK